MMELFCRVVEIKRDNEKLFDRNNGHFQKLQDVRSVVRLTYVNLKKASYWNETLGAQPKKATVQYAEVVEEKIQSEENLSIRTTLQGLSTKAEMDFISRIEEGRGTRVAGDEDVLLDRHEVYNILSCSLWE